MVFLIIIYRIALDIVYSFCASRVFRYIGLGFKFDWVTAVLSWILLLSCLPIVRKCVDKAKFSDVIMLFLIYLAYIPYTTMVAFFGYSAAYIAANSFYWLWLFILYNYLPNFKGNFVITGKRNDVLLTVIEAVFAAVILFISWRYMGFRFTISLSDVYAYRAEAKMASIPILISYLFAASKAVNPILLVYSLSKKKYLNALLIIIIQILSFSINGSKTVLFSTLAAVLFYFFYHDSMLKKIPGVLAVLCFLTYFETEVLGTIFLLAYFVRRVMFVPNQLGSYYFDFFTRNQPDFYQQSFLRIFGIKSQYSDIDHLIGANYFGKSEMGANSGLISDAVTNLGVPGIVILPFVLVIVLKIIDKCSEGINNKIYISTSIVIAFMLISSFLPTVLLTHGLIAVCLVLMLIPRDSGEAVTNNVKFRKGFI